MNAAQIHLALNHAPLFLSILAAILLAFGLIKKNSSIATLSLYLMVAAAILTTPVFLTGEGTEELVENLPGVSENAIEKHEAMAKIALALIVATGVAALIAILLKSKERIWKAALVIAMLLSLFSFVAMAQTAHLGGLIRHSELQNSATGTIENRPESHATDSAGKKSTKEEKKDEDND